MTDKIGQAIEDCYIAFSEYNIPKKLDTSPVHQGKQFLKELSASPLRDLTQDQLGHYAASALTTVGGVEDYKHFLPRILELALAGSGWPGLAPDLVASKLIYGSWRSWPVPEQLALETLYVQAWRRSMHLDPKDYDAAPWLTGTALLGCDLPAACSDVGAANSANATLHLSSFISSQSKALANSRGYWEDCTEEQLGAISTWLLSGKLSSILIKQNSHVHPDDRWQIEAALERLHQLKAHETAN